MTAEVRALETFSPFQYIHARKLRTVRFQCSHCGQFVGRFVSQCQHCGADLR